MSRSKTRCAGLSLAMFFFSISGSTSFSTSLHCQSLWELRPDIRVLDPADLTRDPLPHSQRVLACGLRPHHLPRHLRDKPIHVLSSRGPETGEGTEGLGGGR